MTRLLIISCVALLAGCAEPSKVDKPRSQMTELERDSTIGASRLPGAGVVKKGLSIRNVQNQHAEMLDSAGREN